jgi:tRNA/tmRNA/rRNA uracil-C5-methylase (TrmA/RlmC/RlmD family)
VRAWEPDGSDRCFLPLGASEPSHDGAPSPPYDDGAARASVGCITESLESGLKLRISPAAFFQASTDLAEPLFHTIVDLVSRGGTSFPSLVLDLCCGGGVLGLEVARAAQAAGAATRVVGVELNASSVDDARHNGAANALGPPLFDVMCAKAEDAIEQLLASLEDGADAVAILDPPRTGISPTVSKALRKAAGIRRVILVSCNPHGHTLRHDYVVKGGSLAANTRILCGARGRGKPFTLERATPIDMFPHTPHCELCLHFARRSRFGRVAVG